METYVVWVYRRDPTRPNEIVGIVEQVGAEHTLRFSNAEELRAILIAQGKHQPQGGGTGKRDNSAKA
ncbi:MAG TPA: hypothetical protein VK138_08595 [Acidiferrobacterales bacterium]|nr:hypothetical protein [Acidiferrobacterales bacterium]